MEQQRLIILAGVPDQEEANHKEYRPGCLAGIVNKLGVDINGEPLGRRAIETYAHFFDEIHIVGPARKNCAELKFRESDVIRLDVELIYHDTEGRISDTLRSAAHLIKAFNQSAYVVPNDLLPRGSDLEAFLKRAEEENALLFSTPILAESIRAIGFPKRFYRVKDGNQTFSCAFPQIWKVSPNIPLAPILAVADDFYRHRNNGAYRWGFCKLLTAGLQTYNSLEKETKAYLGRVTSLAAHLSLATKFPFIPPPSLHKAALLLGSFDTPHYRPVSIGHPLNAPSLAMDCDTHGELERLRQLQQAGWYDEAR